MFLIDFLMVLDGLLLSHDEASEKAKALATDGSGLDETPLHQWITSFGHNGRSIYYHVFESKYGQVTFCRPSSVAC
jgi:hypothetical protein